MHGSWMIHSSASGKDRRSPSSNSIATPYSQSPLRSRKASLGGDSSYEIDCSEFAVKLENGIQKAKLLRNLNERSYSENSLLTGNRVRNKKKSKLGLKQRAFMGLFNDNHKDGERDMLTKCQSLSLSDTDSLDSPTTPITRPLTPNRLDPLWSHTLITPTVSRSPSLSPDMISHPTPLTLKPRSYHDAEERCNPQITLTEDPLDSSDSTSSLLESSSSPYPLESEEVESPAFYRDYVRSPAPMHTLSEIQYKTCYNAPSVRQDSVTKKHTEPSAVQEPETPEVTPEMLLEHSLHYYLINNFFLDETSSLASVESGGSRKVCFNLDRNVVISPAEFKRTQCDCEKTRNTAKYAYFNVSGSVFQTFNSTLEKYPRSLLGSEAKHKYYDYSKGVYNFPGRNRDCFESILYFYQSGILRPPKNVDIDTFYEEMMFFKLPERFITPVPFVTTEEPSYEGLVPTDPYTLQSKLFLILYHKSSCTTKVFTFIDILFITISVTSCIISTLKMYREGYEDDPVYMYYGALQEFIHCDGICIIWFFLVFLLRFYAAPTKRFFFNSFMTVVDIGVIIMYLVSVALASTDIPLLWPFLQQLIRFTFCFRILKLARHSILLHSLGLALKEAARELASILLFMFLIVFLFACMEYLVEVKEPTTEEEDEDHIQQTGHVKELDARGEHKTLFDYVWWSLITITTIGYGQMVIESNEGKIVGGLCAIAGVPLFAIPIPIISKHLERVYRREKFRKEYMMKTVKMLAQGIQLENEHEQDSQEISEEEVISWKKVTGSRRKSMGAHFGMQHFNG